MNKFRRLKSDEDGATILEFALIAPVFLFMLLGSFEIGYAIYMRSALNGAIQLAARDASLQDASNAVTRDAIDARVTEVLQNVNNAATVDIERKNYSNFADVDRMEAYTDTDSNGTCDNNEPFTDENANGDWDNVGQGGLGGARDSVLYTITVTYDAVFPLGDFTREAKTPGAGFTLNGLDSQRVLTASTILKNQPYGDQTTRTTTPGNCA